MDASSRDESVQPRRKSAVREDALGSARSLSSMARSRQTRPSMRVRFRSKDEIFQILSGDDDHCSETSTNIEEAAPFGLSQFPVQWRLTSFDCYTLTALVLIAFFFASQVVFLGLRRPPVGYTAVRGDLNKGHLLARRQNSDPTDWCKRWSGQSALVNGTLYYFGGRKSTSSSQTSGTWTNELFAIDLTKSWQITSPSLVGLKTPSTPPAVSLGSLWNSHTSLFLYGGEFSDTPQAFPSLNSLWEYKIAEQRWEEHGNLTTTTGKNSEAAGVQVQRAAEGAGFSLPSLGRGWYFGGHLDFLTTQGWSIETPRIYLKSFVEFTFPGVTNAELSTKEAGPDGAWRNITSAGIQQQSGFTNRADGVLMYVPGFSADGLLLSLGGGTNETFTQMNTIDVYDIAGSQWYKQATTGPTPDIRVNPCAVVAAAADGSSYNIYMFGGQNLIPYDNQTQYNDVWILSVPSFTWLRVDTSGQSIPPARAGHTCNIWDSQMVVVGGYLGANIGCEQPGIYIFNTSSLQWQNQYSALSERASNVFSQQNSQKGPTARDGLEGSYGYQVPPLVYSAIGGGAKGGATKTADNPAGPFFTGSPITYAAAGSSTEGASTSDGSSTSTRNSSNHGAVTGAIVAGVLGILLLLLAVYFAICAIIYRRQMRTWRHYYSIMQDERSEKYNSLYAARSPSFPRRSGHESLIGPYHRASDSARTNETDGLEQGGPSPESSTEDLMEGMQPSFWGWQGVLLHPRRSLRIVNKDDMTVTRDDGSF